MKDLMNTQMIRTGFWTQWEGKPPCHVHDKEFNLLCTHCHHQSILAPRPETKGEGL